MMSEDKELAIGEITLEPHLWDAARRLGKMRADSNKGKAGYGQERGESNERVHLAGALGELILLEWLPKECVKGRAHLIENLYDPKGGSGHKDPDVVIRGGESIDAKAVIVVEGHRFFPINEKKHKHLGQWSELWYFCVVTLPLGKQALVSWPIPHKEASKWACFTLGRWDSPSHNCLLTRFLEYYCKPPGEISDKCYAENEIKGGASLLGSYMATVSRRKRKT